MPCLDCSRLCLRGLRDLGDAEDVVARVGLDRAGDLALDGREDGRVERRVLLALGDAEQLAALVLGGGVDRSSLATLPTTSRRPRPRCLASCALAWLLVRIDLEVAPLGLRELLLVLVVVVLDLAVGDVLAALGDLLADLVREHVEPHPEEQVLLGLAGGLQEALVGLLVRERLVLGLLELALDLLRRSRSRRAPWPRRRSIRGDQELHHLLLDAPRPACCPAWAAAASASSAPAAAARRRPRSQWLKSLLGDRARRPSIVGDVARRRRRRRTTARRRSASTARRAGSRRSRALRVVVSLACEQCWRPRRSSRGGPARRRTIATVAAAGLRAGLRQAAAGSCAFTRSAAASADAHHRRQALLGPRRGSRTRSVRLSDS